MRELQRRGIPTRLITIGLGENDGRDGFPDLHFTSLRTKEQLSDLDDTLIYVTYPLNTPTKHQSYAILHCPMQTCARPDPLFDLSGVQNTRILAPSKFAAKLWGHTLRMRPGRIPAVYPFAEPCFSKVERPERTSQKIKILFAGRLTPDKGIYTLLAALHMKGMYNLDYELTVTDAASDTFDGQIILPMLQANPRVNVIPARKSPQEMAALVAEHDIVLMPSSNIFWKEIFGIVSVEAQHAGARVVASNAGGIPETDCGGMILIKPDDPQALASGIAKAAYLGPLTEAERLYASTKFTATQSVDKLLTIMHTDEQRRKQQHPLLQKQGALVLEQFDYAVNTISQFSSRLARENELS
jgi:glycosyltransferase involved in cell wall biosynthesis